MYATITKESGQPGIIVIPESGGAHERLRDRLNELRKRLDAVKAAPLPASIRELSRSADRLGDAVKTQWMIDWKAANPGRDYDPCDDDGSGEYESFSGDEGIKALAVEVNEVAVLIHQAFPRRGR